MQALRTQSRRRAFHPVSVSIDRFPSLYKLGCFDASIRVDGEDLVQCFGNRVKILQWIDSDGIAFAGAFFAPGLVASDSDKITSLLRKFRTRRNDSDRPIQAPLKSARRVRS